MTARCSVCGRVDNVSKCSRSGCPNYICQRHVLRFEMSDANGLRIDDYCSRRCYMETLRRELPVRLELLIALTVIMIALVLYALVVGWFV